MNKDISHNLNYSHNNSNHNLNNFAKYTDNSVYTNSEETAAHPAAASNPADIFEKVYSNLGDHNGFYVGPYHICDLPYILVDNGQFYFYKNTESLQTSGVFTESHHKIHRTSDGGTPDLDLSVTNLVVFQ